MTAPAVFPLSVRPNGNGPGDLTPLLPIELSHGSVALDLDGLVDTGSSFSALPYDLGLRFGFDWGAYPVAMTLGGTFGRMPAKLVMLMGTVGPFPPVPLLFGWAQSSNVPLILGIATFFLEFDVCVFRSRGEFHVQPRTP